MKLVNTPHSKHLKSKSVIGERRGVSTLQIYYFFTREGGGVSIMSVIHHKIVGKCWSNSNRAFKYPPPIIVISLYRLFTFSINKTLKMWGNVGYFNISNRIKVSDHFWICTFN